VSLSPLGRVLRHRGPSRVTLVAALLGGAGILAAILLRSALLVVLVSVLVLAVSTTVEAKRAGRRWRRGEVLLRGASFACLNLGGALVRRVIRPDYIFVLYAETDRDKRLYFPRWVERLLRPVFPSGLIHFGRYWGMMVAGKATAESFESSPERLQALLDNTREKFPQVQVIALAGRLPSIAASQGVSLDGPFLEGDRGTLCAMIGAAHEQAALLGKTPMEVTIAVPGGDGFIGRQLVTELAREFRAVIALDPRLEDQHGWRENVLFTHQPEDIARAQAVLVLTARGEETADIVPYLAPGTLVAGIAARADGRRGCHRAQGERGGSSVSHTTADSHLPKRRHPGMPAGGSRRGASWAGRSWLASGVQRGGQGNWVPGTVGPAYLEPPARSWADVGQRSPAPERVIQVERASDRCDEGGRVRSGRNSI